MRLTSELIIKDTKLGEGSYGVCFLGTFRGIKCVIKELKGKRFHQDQRAELLREAEVMGRLQCHRNIPTLLGVDISGSCLVIQFYGSGTHATTLHVAVKALRVHQPTKLCWELADGLHAVHESGFIHNDLHSGNVVLNADGSPVIIDFGRATAEGDARGRPNVRDTEEDRNHFRWIDPEVIARKTLPGRASDVYSYGYLVGRVLKGPGNENVYG